LIVTNVLGIIPARGGSKGIPNKNLRPLAGRPLLAYAAEAAMASGVINRLVLSTDSEAIAELGTDLGIEVPFMRPAELAKDDSPMLPVLQHAVNEIETSGWQVDIIVLLQPTSPMRKPKHIADAVNLLTREKSDSVVSVIEIPDAFSPQKALHLHKNHLRFLSPEAKSITRRQQLETFYAREGTVYAVWRDVLLGKDGLYGDYCLPLILNRDESLSIDSEADWEEAEGRLTARRVDVQ
jgi:CMP-N,N'-diacetyllegionaminic acid synthase